jgi:hypothetical protein
MPLHWLEAISNVQPTKWDIVFHSGTSGSVALESVVPNKRPVAAPDAAQQLAFVQAVLSNAGRPRATSARRLPAATTLLAFRTAAIAVLSFRRDTRSLYC